ncbi:hypothetical protein [Hyphomicrobium sp.]|uniref:hypothetical protein n=1 Tax=Hyphomicrobium sp. TaxID=82 RepID=UPI000FB4782F|nr:hypothetical protein [Hyphomicrobium sp.]RUP00216.1 MAG: hypothetical protein EKK30_03660 [Hyphomicrobium sp.]
MTHSDYNALLFRIALARARPCYCYGCICLTPDERAYERRVFRLARAWSKALKRAEKKANHPTAR